MRTNITKKLLAGQPLENQKTIKNIQYGDLDFSLSIFTKAFKKTKYRPCMLNEFRDVEIKQDKDSHSFFYSILLPFLLNKKMLNIIDIVKISRLCNPCVIESHMSESYLIESYLIESHLSESHLSESHLSEYHKLNHFVAYKNRYRLVYSKIPAQKNMNKERYTICSMYQSKKQHTLGNISFDMFRFENDVLRFENVDFAMSETIVSNELFEFVMGYEIDGMGYIEAMYFCNKLSEIFNLKPYYKVSIFLENWSYTSNYNYDKKYEEIHSKLKDKKNYVLGGNGFRLPNIEEKRTFESINDPNPLDETWEIIENTKFVYDNMTKEKTYYMSISNSNKQEIKYGRLESEAEGQYDIKLRIARTINQ